MCPPVLKPAERDLNPKAEGEGSPAVEPPLRAIGKVKGASASQFQNSVAILRPASMLFVVAPVPAAGTLLGLLAQRRFGTHRQDVVEMFAGHAEASWEL